VPIFGEAADEIERLRNELAATEAKLMNARRAVGCMLHPQVASDEIERLRPALRCIIETAVYASKGTAPIIGIARAALEGKSPTLSNAYTTIRLVTIMPGGARCRTLPMKLSGCVRPRLTSLRSTRPLLSS
jgi:hypothetical protein